MTKLWESAATFRRGLAEKVAFLLLNQLDLVLTISATSLGLFELNPFMRSLLTNLPELFLVKLIIPVFIAWLIPGRLLLPAIVLLFLVVTWDLKELLFFLL